MNKYQFYFDSYKNAQDEHNKELVAELFYDHLDKALMTEELTQAEYDDLSTAFRLLDGPIE